VGLLFVSVVTALLPGICSADVIVLANGDRITGEITRIWDSEITIEPDYTDEFDVEMETIVSITTDRDLEIELIDGRRELGRFTGPDDSGSQQLSLAGEVVAVQLEELFEVDEPDEEFDLEGLIDFSANVSEGNTDSLNAQLRGDATLVLGKHRHLGEVRFVREETEGESLKQEDLFTYTYNWLFNDDWFFQSQATFERDPIIELDSRIIVSAGIGRDIWNTPRRGLSLQLGAGLQTEEFSMESEDSSVLSWSLRYRQDLLKEDLELFHNHSIIENISGRENTSYKTSTGFRYEFIEDVYANLSVNFDYETDPPEGAEQEDIALVIGIGAEF
jgi:putative salt-induced outer membrane protein YdiY